MSMAPRSIRAKSLVFTFNGKSSLDSRAARNPFIARIDFFTQFMVTILEGTYEPTPEEYFDPECS